MMLMVHLTGTEWKKNKQIRDIMEVLDKMELIDTIKNRRSIRKYTNEEVPNELLEDLIECARLAPSAKNRQPWKFIIIKNDIKNQIADIMIKNEETPEREIDTNSSVKFTAGIMKDAPVLILVLKEYDEDWNSLLVEQ